MATETDTISASRTPKPDLNPQQRTIGQELLSLRNKAEASILVAAGLQSMIDDGDEEIGYRQIDALKECLLQLEEGIDRLYEEVPSIELPDRSKGGVQ